jgi:hypothetical protein
MTVTNKPEIGIMERAVLRRLISDLGGTNELYFKDAADFLERPEFMEICERAQYPETLLDTLKEFVKQTAIQRKQMAAEVLEVLRSQWKN